MGLHRFVSLVVVILFVSSTSIGEEDDTIDLPQIVQYQLLSIHSGKFIGVTGDGCIHAMGDIRDPRTRFIPRFTQDGRIAFESYCFMGQFILIDNSTRIRLDFPSNDSELFEQISPFPGTFAYKSASIEDAMCFLSFDSFGNAHDKELCFLDMGHLGMLINYLESMTNVPCDHTQLKSAKLEL